MKTTTAVLHTGGMYRGSEKSVVEQALSRLLAVASVEANPVAQTATVTYDPTGTSLAALQRLSSAAACIVPGPVGSLCLCDPLAEQEPLAPAQDPTAAERAEHGHGHGWHARMSRATMVRDMRNLLSRRPEEFLPLDERALLGRDIHASLLAAGAR